jgi:hypothetical protein
MGQSNKKKRKENKMAEYLGSIWCDYEGCQGSHALWRREDGSEIVVTDGCSHDVSSDVNAKLYELSEA